MDIFYILIFMVALVFLIKPVVYLILSGSRFSQLTRIKVKVFFRTYFSPVLFGLILLFALLTDNKVYNTYVGVGLFIGSLVGIFFRAGKFVTALKVDTTQLEIWYLTSFLKKKYFKVNLNEIVAVETTQKNRLFDYPASLNIKVKKEWGEFLLLGKDMQATIKKEIEAAKIGVDSNYA